MKNEKTSNKIIEGTCYLAISIYLFVHIVYLVLFIVTRHNALIWVSALSVVFYGLFFIVLYKKKFYLYALLCGNEIFIYVILATILAGFNSGFHLLLIGLCVVSFFASYFTKGRKIINSVIWTILSLIIYLTLYFVTRFVNPYYVIEEWLEMVLFTIHAVASFAFVASYLFIFLKFAFKLEKRIMSESRTDELTQISNRYGLYDYLDEINDKTQHYLAIFDIDDFKVVNDTYGHVCGDYILKEIAKISSENLSDYFVGRYGGEEFIIVTNPTSKKECIQRLEELRKIIEKFEFKFEDKIIKVTITIGVAEYSKQMKTEDWLEVADKKLYKGKASGKNQTVY